MRTIKNQFCRRVIISCILAMAIVSAMPSGVSAKDFAKISANTDLPIASAAKVAEFREDGDASSSSHNWTIDRSTGKLAEYLEPGKEYSVNFFIFPYGESGFDTGAYIGFYADTNAGSNTEYWACPDTSSGHRMMLLLGYDNAYGEDYYWSPCLKSGNEAAKIQLDWKQIRIYQAYGNKSWTYSQCSSGYDVSERQKGKDEKLFHVETDQFFIKDYASIDVGSDSMNGVMSRGIENALVVSFDFSVSAQTYSSPVEHYSQDGKVQYYDFANPVYEERYSSTKKTQRETLTEYVESMTYPENQSDMELALRYGKLKHRASTRPLALTL